MLQVKSLSKEWANRADLPAHVVTMLNNFPSNLHPMSQFSAAITALNSESKYAKAYSEGLHKSKYWEVSSTVFKETCSLLNFLVFLSLINRFLFSMCMRIQWT